MGVGRLMMGVSEGFQKKRQGMRKQKSSLSKAMFARGREPATRRPSMLP